MTSPLTYAEAQELNAGIHELARNPDPIAAFNAIADVFEADPALYGDMHIPNPETGVTLRNPGPDATRMAAKYQRNVAGAAQSYVEGVQSPKRSFKSAAIAAAGKHTQRTQQALQEGRFARAMAQVDEQEAIAMATSDGGAAYTAGAAKRQPKVTRSFARLAPLLGSVSQTIAQMPQDTDAQREQRLLTARKLMIEAGKRYKGGS
jgi:hypothetical protein